MPALGDKLAAKRVGRQRTDQPPRKPGGALYEPSESGRIHGLPQRDAALAGDPDE
jgi:hypothetical protein